MRASADDATDDDDVLALDDRGCPGLGDEHAVDARLERDGIEVEPVEVVEQADDGPAADVLAAGDKRFVVAGEWRRDHALGVDGRNQALRPGGVMADRLDRTAQVAV